MTTSLENQVFSQLSSKTAAQESLGVKNQAWQPSSSGGASGLDDLLSLDWLRAQPDLPILVQVLPAARLHMLLQKEGLEEAEEIVEWIRGDQLVRVFDFEIWRSPPAVLSGDGQDLVVSAAVFLDWVRVWNEISPEFAADRFMELEEETMVLLANALFEIVPVGFENGRSGSDDFFLTPDSKFYLKVKSEVSANTQDEELAYLFARSLYAANIGFAGRILSYAAMLLGAEAEFAALGLRRGRLADEGFVAKDEALALLRPRQLGQWNETFIQACIENESKVVSVGDLGSDAADPELFDRIYAFWKALPQEEYVSAAKSLLGQEEMLQISGVSNPPDYIIESDDNIRIETAERSVKNSLKKLQALSLLALGQQMRGGELGAESEASLLVNRVLFVLAEDEPLRVLQIRQRMARLANAVASLMDDPASADAQLRALSILRGNLNIGLQWLLAKTPSIEEIACSEFGELLQRQEALALHEAVELFVQIGVERVFQAGMDLLHALSTVAAKTFDATLAETQTRTQQEGCLKLELLLKTFRFAELRQAVHKIEDESLGALEALDLILARCLLNRFAFFPAVLGLKHVQEALDNKEPISLLQIRTDVKVFESCSEVTTVLRALRRNPASGSKTSVSV